MGSRRNVRKASTRRRQLAIDVPGTGPSLLYLLHEFLQKLASKHRTQRTNRQLGGALAFVAGAINAGGSLAAQRCTSHMSGAIAFKAMGFSATIPVALLLVVMAAPSIGVDIRLK